MKVIHPDQHYTSFRLRLFLQLYLCRKIKYFVISAADSILRERPFIYIKCKKVNLNVTKIKVGYSQVSVQCARSNSSHQVTS